MTGGLRNGRASASGTARCRRSDAISRPDGSSSSAPGRRTRDRARRPARSGERAGQDRLEAVARPSAQLGHPPPVADLRAEPGRRRSARPARASPAARRPGRARRRRSARGAGGLEGPPRGPARPRRGCRPADRPRSHRGAPRQDRADGSTEGATVSRLRSAPWTAARSSRSLIRRRASASCTGEPGRVTHSMGCEIGGAIAPAISAVTGAWLRATRLGVPAAPVAPSSRTCGPTARRPGAVDEELTGGRLVSRIGVGDHRHLDARVCPGPRDGPAPGPRLQARRSPSRTADGRSRPAVRAAGRMRVVERRVGQGVTGALLPGGGLRQQPGQGVPRGHCIDPTSGVLRDWPLPGRRSPAGQDEG